MRLVVRNNQDGTSLIEVLMVLIVLAITLGLGLPQLQEVLSGGRMRAAREQLTLALAHARSEAVMRGRNVVVCPGTERAGCSDSIFWHRGWVSFEDRNYNGSRDTGEPEVGVGGPHPGVKIAATDGRRHVRYRLDGSSDGSNVTLTFCDARGADRATAIVIGNTGRVRRAAVKPGNAAAACGAE